MKRGIRRIANFRSSPPLLDSGGEQFFVRIFEIPENLSKHKVGKDVTALPHCRSTAERLYKREDVRNISIHLFYLFPTFSTYLVGKGRGYQGTPQTISISCKGEMLSCKGKTFEIFRYTFSTFFQLFLRI